MKTKMKFFRLLILIGIFILSTTSTIMAQNNKTDLSNNSKKTPEERTAIIINKMTAKLTLNANQVPKVHDIILEREKQKDLVLASFKNDKEKLKQARIARNKKADDALKIVLDKDQYQALINWRKEAKQKKNNKTSVGPAPDNSADDI